MGRQREVLVFGIALIVCCLLVAGFLVSRQITRLAVDDPASARAPAMLVSLDSLQAVVRDRNQRLLEARGIQRLILLSLLLSAFGALVVALEVRKEVRERRESERAVRETLHLVDERVRERTIELSRANQRLQDALEARAEALSREQQARASAERANGLKDRFLSTISHELRTPLNAIFGWTHVLKLGTLPAGDVQHAIDAIDRNARVQARLITDLLDVSRMIQGRVVLTTAPTNLRAAVDAAVDAMRPAIAAKGLILKYEAGADEVSVLGDAGRLQHIVTNLLANAVKFTPRDGQIEVDLTADGVFAKICVRDTGEGIAPDVLPQVFDPFFQGTTQAKRAGLGLGLAIVKELVDLHGGTVTVTSEGPASGATFTVRLPMIYAQTAPFVPVMREPSQSERPRRPDTKRRKLFRLFRRKLSSRSG